MMLPFTAKVSVLTNKSLFQETWAVIEDGRVHGLERFM